MTIEFRQDTATAPQIAAHLAACDADFDPPLTGRVDIAAYAEKLAERATRFEAWSDSALVGLVAAYCNNQLTLQGFVTSVSVVPEWLGQGLGGRLMKDCLTYAARAGMQQMRLEVGKTNVRAIGLYRKLGFTADPASDGPSLVMRLNLRG